MDAGTSIVSTKIVLVTPDAKSISVLRTLGRCVCKHGKNSGRQKDRRAAKIGKCRAKRQDTAVDHGQHSQHRDKRDREPVKVPL